MPNKFNSIGWGYLRPARNGLCSRKPLILFSRWRQQKLLHSKDAAPRPTTCVGRGGYAALGHPGGALRWNASKPGIRNFSFQKPITVHRQENATRHYAADSSGINFVYLHISAFLSQSLRFSPVGISSSSHDLPVTSDVNGVIDVRWTKGTPFLSKFGIPAKNSCRKQTQRQKTTMKVELPFTTRLLDGQNRRGFCWYAYTCSIIMSKLVKEAIRKSQQLAALCMYYRPVLFTYLAIIHFWKNTLSACVRHLKSAYQLQREPVWRGGRW